MISNELFRYFLKVNYANVDISNEMADATCAEFIKYLTDTIPTEKLKNFMPTSLTDVILKMKDPFLHHGFHPAFVFHFAEFVRIEKAKCDAEDAEESKNLN